MSPSLTILDASLYLNLFSRCFHEPKLMFWIFSAASYFIAPPSVTTSYYQRAEEEGVLVAIVSKHCINNHLTCPRACDQWPGASGILRSRKHHLGAPPQVGIDSLCQGHTPRTEGHSCQMEL